MRNTVVLTLAVIALASVSNLYSHDAGAFAGTQSERSRRPLSAPPPKTLPLSSKMIWVGQSDSSRGLTDINKAHTVELMDNQVNIRINRGASIESRDSVGIDQARSVLQSKPDQWVHISSAGGGFVKTYVNIEKFFNVAFINTGSGDAASITLDTGEHLPSVTDTAAVARLKSIVIARR